MARLPYLDPADVPASQQDLVSGHLNFTRAFTHCPEGMRKLKGLMTHLREHGTVDPRLRELALIQVGYTAPCPYEYAHHIKTGLRSGVSPDDIRAIAEESAGRPTALEPRAKAVLDAARQLTTGIDVDDETFTVLHRELGSAQLMELFLAIATYTAMVRLLTAIRVDVEPDYAPYLEQFPIAHDLTTSAIP
jgi:alkylhydroperoxidase family enzyme